MISIVNLYKCRKCVANLYNLGGTLIVRIQCKKIGIFIYF